MSRHVGHPATRIGLKPGERPVQERRHAIVIGGGLAGLAASVELSTRGFDVTIVERNEHLGGKMNVTEESGFSFDMGPTILTIPDILRGIIRRSGRKVEDYIDLVELDPQWRCFYEDGTVLDLRKDLDTMAEALDRQFPEAKPGQGWKDFINYSRRMYRLSKSVFFYKDLGGIGDMIRKPPPREPGLLGDVMSMRLYSTVAKTIHKYINEPHVCQLSEHFLQYVGSSPFLAPAILTLIASAQIDDGIWYSRGGTRKVAASLERILHEEGVTVMLGKSVRRLVTDDDNVRGVELEDGTVLESDVVVSNCDIQRTYRDLDSDPVAKEEQKSIARKYEPACSGVVLYLGLKRQYDHLAHHCFLFSEDSRKEFDDIYRKGVPAEDPTIYLAVPSRTDPDQAPAGHEALYILVHTPYRRGTQRWEGPGGMLEQYRKVIIEKLKRCAGLEDIEEQIVVERFLTPDSIERLYNAEGGAIYGLASHGRFKGGFKPKNRSAIYQNLYLAGGSVNPGPGVPMVLMSGVTAADAVCEDLGVSDQRTAEEPECPEPTLTA
ncbi:MAG: phytoene desaturase family protein [Phycisphaerales bacterium]|nr:phytoene desaturase family protein [Phycisphaerales bacterium]